MFHLTVFVFSRGTVVHGATHAAPRAKACFPLVLQGLHSRFACALLGGAAAGVSSARPLCDFCLFPNVFMISGAPCSFGAAVFFWPSRDTLFCKGIEGFRVSVVFGNVNGSGPWNVRPFDVIWNLYMYTDRIPYVVSYILIHTSYRNIL